MNKQIIAANWKMNGNSLTLTHLTDELTTKLNALPQVSDKAEVILLPPFIYISLIRELIKDSVAQLGAQNVSQFENGAYTGEISAEMLKDIGCDYCLVGHSERRQLMAENEAIIAEKILRLQQANITPIICVGETKSEREQNQTFAVISRQLDTVIHTYSQSQTLIIAYEPVWAIGTGLSATPETVQETHAFIRAYLSNQLSTILPEQIKILYGGSVKAHNSSTLLSMQDVDGALVGGASLDIEEFVRIIQCSKYF